MALVKLLSGSRSWELVLGAIAVCGTRGKTLQCNVIPKRSLLLLLRSIS